MFLCSGVRTEFGIEPAERVLLVRSSSTFKDRCEAGESEKSVFARGLGCMSITTLSVLCRTEGRVKPFQIADTREEGGALSSKSESSKPLSGRAIGAVRASETRAVIRHNG